MEGSTHALIFSTILVGNSLKVLKKAMKTPVRKCLGKDLNWTPPEYKLKLLPLEPTRSFSGSDWFESRPGY